MLPEHFEKGKYDQGNWEFVVVGRSQVLEFPTGLVILQVERDSASLTRRVNIGEVSEEAWMKAERTWKLIALV